MTTAAGDAHIQAKLNELRTLLGQHMQDFAETPGSAGIIAYAVYMGATALQSQKDLIEAQFKAWKVPFKLVPYYVIGSDQLREPAKGTILINPNDGVPSVYVEDNLVFFIKATASSTSSSSAAQSLEASSQ